MRAVRFVGVGHPAQIADVVAADVDDQKLDQAKSLARMTLLIIATRMKLPMGESMPGTTEFPLEQAVAVYDKLKAGEITGRAVLVPDGA